MWVKRIVVLENTLNCLRDLHIWPQEDQTMLRYYIMFIVTIIKTSYYIIGMCVYIYIIHRDNLNADSTETLSLIFSISILYYSLLAFVYNYKGIAELLTRLSDFERFGKPDNFEPRSRQLNFYSKLMMIYGAVGTFAYVLTKQIEIPMCNRARREENRDDICGIIGTWAPFSLESQIVRFLVISSQWYAASFVVQAGAMGSFVLYEAAEHIVLRIKHLKRLFAEVFNDQNPRVQRRRLIHCIKYHCYIIELQTKLNKHYAHTNSVAVTTSAVIMGMLLTLLSKKFNGGAFLNLGGWVVGIFIRCHAGEQLFCENEKIATSIFVSTNWHRVRDLGLIKDLSMVILRAQKPFTMNALIGNMSYALYVSVVKTSYSYFTLLSQTMQDE